MLIDGNKRTMYHEKLELNNRKDVMNVYTPHVTEDKKKALVFYDEDEVQKMSHFLCTTFCSAKVIPL